MATCMYELMCTDASSRLPAEPRVRGCDTHVIMCLTALSRLQLLLCRDAQMWHDAGAAVTGERPTTECGAALQPARERFTSA